LLVTDIVSSNPLRCTALYNKVCRWLAAGLWFSPGTPVSTTNKTDHYITEILLKVALNTIKPSLILHIQLDKHRSPQIHTCLHFDRGRNTVLKYLPVIKQIYFNKTIHDVHQKGQITYRSCRFSVSMCVQCTWWNKNWYM
jgi:hypothetical protein